MAVSAIRVREIIDDSLDLMKKRIDISDSHVLAKLESIRSVLIRNEKKIWLRTKKGRNILSEVSEAADNLRTILDSPNEITKVKLALSDVEALVQTIDEESRKRSMIVT